MLRWFPWKQLVSRVARARGLVDPVKILSRLESFAQPMEVKEPLELLRAGLVFHARGLLNTNAIQHNLDWVWPYWVERQYDPLDVAFIPRAFSITHVNLTHRNWTAVGLPDLDELPLIDPRGLVTPFWDGWSIDGWVLGDDGEELIPSRRDEVCQELELQDLPRVITRSSLDGLEIVVQAHVERFAGGARLSISYDALSREGGWLAVSLRPYNPEGVSFVHRLDAVATRHRFAWRVDGKHRVELLDTPERHLFSVYRRGDVYRHLRDEEMDPRRCVSCRVGMASAAALYRLSPEEPRRVEVRVRLEEGEKSGGSRGAPSWSESLAETARLEVPDQRFRFLYDAAVRTLILHSPGEVYPGPYTYKRFWFRDASFILAGMLAVGLEGRVGRTLDLFPSRQTRKGHFFSQEGEWDSNGEALWILERYCSHTGRSPKPEWRRAVVKGARWIGKMRVRPKAPESPHAGLLPAGFSAEHLGPNDYYYWDDFWSVAGLRSAARLLEAYEEAEAAETSRAEAEDLLAAIDRSLETCAARLGRPGMPASPYRRLDPGAIGSLAAGYPVQVFRARDLRLLDTVEFLLDRCFVDGGFFQDMIHSGVNPYLTLHVAQVLLRADDPRAWDLITTVADLASPTGQWPEAIHPRTGGGCMGDGQHVWAAAEWILALRNCFVREEGEGLVLAGGIPEAWLAGGEQTSFGPTPTPFGPITVSVRGSASDVEVNWQGEWRVGQPPVSVRLPGHAERVAARGESRILVARGEVGACGS